MVKKIKENMVLILADVTKQFFKRQSVASIVTVGCLEITL